MENGVSAEGSECLSVPKTDRPFTKHFLPINLEAYLRAKFKSSNGQVALSNGNSNHTDDDKKLKPKSTSPLITSGWAPFHTPQDRVDAWKASRLAGDGSLIPVAHSRPLTPRNVKLALKLAPTTLLGIMKLYWESAGFSLVVYLMGKFVGGIRERHHFRACDHSIDRVLLIVPAWHAVTLAALLDCVRTFLTP